MHPTSLSHHVHGYVYVAVNPICSPGTILTIHIIELDTHPLPSVRPLLVAWLMLLVC